MKNNIIENAIKYSNMNGIPGHEEYVAQEFKKDLQAIGEFEYERDNLGSIAIIKRSKNPNAKVVTISTHLDEVGFVVTHIDQKGFVKITPLGGWWSHVVLGQRFTITTRSGEEIIGVAGSKPPHVLPMEARVKTVPLDQIFLDLGASSRKEVEEWGIQLGDMITPYQDKAFQTKNENRIVGKAHDNRISMVAGIEIMRELANKELDVTVILVGTAQEEVGLRGAKTSAHKWTGDLSFTVDVTICNGMPGMPEKDVKMGTGAALSMFDRSVIANIKLLDSMREFAKTNNIDFTLDSLVGGGTDSGSIHLTKDGVITMTVSIPSRYFHSHNSMIDVRDVESVSKLLSGYISELNDEKIENLKFN